MTNEQFYFYAFAGVTGILAAATFFTLLRISNKTWGKIGKALADACLMSMLAGAFAVVVAPVYVLTRLNDGLQAFMDAALPEVSGLIYRVRAAARAQSEQRLAAWNKSIEYDRHDHAVKMAEFDTAEEEDSAEEAYSSVGVGERY